MGLRQSIRTDSTPLVPHLSALKNQKLSPAKDRHNEPLSPAATAIKDIEHRGYHQTHDIIKKLNTSFITPFDREGIYALAVIAWVLTIPAAAIVAFASYLLLSPFLGK
jgi:hypothetical protein